MCRVEYVCICTVVGKGVYINTFERFCLCGRIRYRNVAYSTLFIGGATHIIGTTSTHLVCFARFDFEKIAWYTLFSCSTDNKTLFESEGYYYDGLFLHH